MNLPRLWNEANLEERRKLLLSMLDAVYVDAKQTKSIVAIKPKPPFKPVFQVAASREGPDIRILNEPLEGSSVFLVETGEGRLFVICNPHSLSALLVVLACSPDLAPRKGVQFHVSYTMVPFLPK